MTPSSLSSLVKALEETFVADGKCPHNRNEVPAEGVVLRIDHLETAECYKLKNFAFLERETKLLDKGEMDLETAQSEEEENVESCA